MQFDSWNIFDPRIFDNFIIVSIIIVVLWVALLSLVCFANTRDAHGVAQDSTMETPPFAIPDRHRGQTRYDGSEMTTVRLPAKCPLCGAAINQEGIDWVGPLEAKCSYCGGTLRASFERV